MKFHINRQVLKALQRITVVAIFLTGISSSMSAQDFLGNFTPDSQKQQSSKTATKKSTTTTKKVNLPDKPNKVDEQGRKQGEWAKKYPNGRYMYTATFKNDKPVGKVTRYDEKGKKTMELTYSTKSDTVKVVTYHSNGNISGRGQYINQKREGLWRFYTKEGKLVESDTYSQNKLHGKRCLYFSNGNMQSVCTWVDSLREGDFVKYYQSGSKEISATFHNDELEGKYTSWGSDGKISEQGYYKSGVRVGKWHLRYTEADVEADIEYDSHGLVKNEETLDSLNVLRQQYYDKNIGKIKDPEDYINNPEELLNLSPSSR